MEQMSELLKPGQEMLARVVAKMGVNRKEIEEDMKTS
jgi:hypothetical protein